MKTENSINIYTKIMLLLGANVALMAGSSLSPGMPAMMAEFATIQGAEFWVSMIITLPALFVVIGGPIAGFFTDRFGRKLVLVVSLLLCGLSGSAGYLLDDISPILFTRALVGLSIAGATTATNSLIADYFEGQQRAKFMGLQAAFTGLSGVVFLSIGGFLADINWHYAFLTHLPLLVLFPLAIIFIDEPVAVSQNAKSIIESRLTLNPTLIYIFVAIFLSQFTFVTIPVYIAYFMTALLGVGGLAIGLVGAVSGFFSFLGGMLYERIGRKVSYRGVAVSGYLLFGVGFLALGLASSWFLIIVGQLIVGFCLGLSVSNLTTWLANQVSLQVRGRANGIFVMMMFLGNFAASLIFTPILQVTSYNFIYILSAAIIILTGLAGRFLKQDRIQVEGA